MENYKKLRKNKLNNSNFHLFNNIIKKNKKFSFKNFISKFGDKKIDLSFYKKNKYDNLYPNKIIKKSLKNIAFNNSEYTLQYKYNFDLVDNKLDNLSKFLKIKLYLYIKKLIKLDNLKQKY